MKKQLLTKLLLVAVALLVGGVNSAWAVTYNTTVTGIVGATDNTSGFNVVGSKQMSLAAGDEYVITFVNYNKGADGTNYWANWSFCSEVFNCRADHGESNPYWGTATNVNYTGSSWTDISSTINEWLQAYNGVTVTLTVSRDAAGTGITVSHSATTKAVASITSQTYAGTFTATVGAEASINFYLTVENAHLNITKVVYNGTEFNYVSSESAYVDQGNSATNYNGENVDNLLVYYTQYRDWGNNDGTMKFNNGGKIALYKFDLTAIKNKLNTDGGTITGVTFSVYGNGDGGVCDKVRVLGYNPEWGCTTVTQGNLTNNSGTITGVVSATGSFQPLNETGERSFASGGTTLNENALTYVNSAIAANKDYVTFAIAANYTRQGKLNTCANLKFEYSASVVYTATFTNTVSGNHPTVTIYTDSERTSSISNGSLENGETYYFTATETGYHNYNGSFTVDGAEPNVEFAMTAKTQFTYNVYAVNSSSVKLQNDPIATSTVYEDETATVKWSKYIKIGEQWYVTSETSFYATATEAGSKNVVYTESDIAYFYEMENLTRSGGSYLTEEDASYSNRSRLRLARGSLYFTPALPAGVYTLNIGVVNSNNTSNEVYVYTRSSEGVLSDKLYTHVAEKGSSTINTVITVPEGYSIAFNGNEGGSANNNARMDYMTLTPYKESKPITAAGWATYCSPYALDLANATGLTDAYIVTGGAGGVLAKTSVKGGTVAAGTGLLLKGSAGTVTIPVVASGTDYSATNKLVGVTANTEIDAEAGYVLMNDATNGLGFYLNSNAFTVGANTAYLPANFDATSARGFFALDGDATGISTIAKSQEPNANSYYDLQGRRVAQPTKGLYIKDGKKVIVK